MVSRLLALPMAGLAGLFGVAFGLLALEEIAPETDEVRACVHSIERESRSRGSDLFPLRPDYLVIETDRNPERFVHYLGSLGQTDEIARSIRPGDCVRITVDRAALDGPQLEETTELGPAVDEWFRDRGLNPVLGKRGLKTFALGWPLVPSYDRPWVRIQRLERGSEELISPRDALLWPLIVLGGIALVCFAVAARQLRLALFGTPAK